VRWLVIVDKDNEREKRSEGDRLESGMNGNSSSVKAVSTRGCRINDDDDDDDIWTVL
jgi:hypothetical protein